MRVRMCVGVCACPLSRTFVITGCFVERLHSLTLITADLNGRNRVKIDRQRKGLQPFNTEHSLCVCVCAYLFFPHESTLEFLSCTQTPQINRLLVPLQQFWFLYTQEDLTNMTFILKSWHRQSQPYKIILSSYVKPKIVLVFFSVSRLPDSLLLPWPFPRHRNDSFTLRSRKWGVISCLVISSLQRHVTDWRAVSLCTSASLETTRLTLLTWTGCCRRLSRGRDKLL